jgi:hypothetical protein
VSDTIQIWKLRKSARNLSPHAPVERRGKAALQGRVCDKKKE